MKRVFTAIAATLIVVLVGAAAGLTFGPISGGTTPEPLSVLNRPDLIEPIRQDAGLVEIERLITAYEGRIETHTDALDHAFLGELYLERARVADEINDYALAKSALSTAIELYPANVDAVVALAKSELALHQFSAALERANDALELDGARYDAVAVRADALTQRGDYGAAFAALDSLQAALPDDPAVVVRASNAAFLRGDVEEALRLAEEGLALVDELELADSRRSWYLSYQANLLFQAGRIAEAGTAYSLALEIEPASDIAQAGLGRVAAARGDYHTAIAWYETATALFPHPEHLVELVAVFEAADMPVQARATVEALEGTLTLGPDGVFDRIVAEGFANAGFNVERALEIAATELEIRKDVHGYDVYAWALYRAGRYEDARAASDLALAMGTASADFLYHSGMISVALGDQSRGRADLEAALALNAHFSPVGSRVARDTLSGLDA